VLKKRRNNASQLPSAARHHTSVPTVGEHFGCSATRELIVALSTYLTIRNFEGSVVIIILPDGRTNSDLGL